MVDVGPLSSSSPPITGLIEPIYLQPEDVEWLKKMEALLPLAERQGMREDRKS